MTETNRFAEMSIEGFTKALRSSAPVPGGGGAAAYVAAAGIALGGMVGALTTGKKKYADVEEEIVKLMKRADEMRTRFLTMIDEDAKAFEPLSRAYALPKDDASREAVLEGALFDAADAPLSLMRSCLEALDIVDGFAKKGSRLAISDAGCAAVFLKAAMEAASLNVMINTRLMKDREAAAQRNKETEVLLNKGKAKADTIVATITKGLCES